MRQVLIISKEKETICEIADLLHSYGFSHIVTASDTKSIQAKIYQMCPRLIILDCDMEQSEMLKVQKVISGPLTEITILIAPVQNKDSCIFSGLKNGFTHFLIKPIGKRQFNFTVNEIMEKGVNDFQKNKHSR